MAKKTTFAATHAMQVRDEIYKQKWLASGMTAEEYERSQLLKELFRLAIVHGSLESDLMVEFRNRTGKELIEKYGCLLPTDSPFRATFASKETQK
jgi:hypothetical protein